MSKQKYSVVIALYNKESTIDRTLNSVMIQNHNVEVIVIDDGSTDDGPKRVRSRRDSRIRLIQQQNLGVSAARNRGIEEASNGLVAFIDADDEWLPGFLDAIDNLIAKFPTAGAFTTAYAKVYNEEIVFLDHPKIRHPFIGMVDYFHYAKDGDFFCSSSIVVRKELLKQIGGFRTDLWLWEDSDAWGRLAFRYEIAYTSETKAKYYLHGENHATKKRSVVVSSFVDSANDYLIKHPERGTKDLLEYANMVLYHYSLYNIYSGYPVEARSMLRRRPSNAIFWKILYCYFISLVPRRITFFMRNILRKIITEQSMG